MAKTTAKQLAVKVKLSPTGTIDEFNSKITEIENAARLKPLKIKLGPQGKIGDVVEQINAEIAKANIKGIDLKINTDKIAATLSGAIDKALSQNHAALNIESNILGSLQNLSMPIDGIISGQLIKEKESVKQRLAEISNEFKENERVGNEYAHQLSALEQQRASAERRKTDTASIDAEIAKIHKADEERLKAYRSLQKEQQELEQWQSSGSQDNAFDQKLRALSSLTEGVAASSKKLRTTVSAFTKYTEATQQSTAAENEVVKNTNEISNAFTQRAEAAQAAASELSKYRTQLTHLGEKKESTKDSGSYDKDSSGESRKKGFDYTADFDKATKSAQPLFEIVSGLEAEHEKLATVLGKTKQELADTGKISEATAQAYEKQREALNAFVAEGQEKLSVFKSLDSVYSKINSLKNIELTPDFEGQTEFLKNVNALREMFNNNGIKLSDWGLEDLKTAKSLLRDVIKMEAEIKGTAIGDKRLTAAANKLAEGKLTDTRKEIAPWLKSLNGLDSAYAKLVEAQAAVEKAQLTGKTVTDDMTKAVNDQKNAIDKLIKSAKERSALSGQFNSAKNYINRIKADDFDQKDSSNNQKSIELYQKIQKAQEMLRQNNNNIVNWNTNDLKQVLQLAQDIEKVLGNIASKADYEKPLSDFVSQMTSWQELEKTPVFAGQEDFIKTLNEARDLLGKNKDTLKDWDTSSLQRMVELMDELNRMQKEIQKQSQTDKQITNEQRKVENLIARIKAYLELNDKIQNNKTLHGEFSSLLDGLSKSSTSFSDGELRFVQLKNAALEAGVATQSLGARLASLFSDHFKTAVAMGALHLLQNSLRQVYQNVKEIDAAMVELKKVTDETSATYTRFLDNAANRARALGASIADVVNATADFARLGYSLDEASVLADAATVYKNVGDGIADIGEASESVISTMKAFGIEAENAMSIIDKFNEVGKTYCPAA